MCLAASTAVPEIVHPPPPAFSTGPYARDYKYDGTVNVALKYLLQLELYINVYGDVFNSSHHGGGRCDDECDSREQDESGLDHLVDFFNVM